MQAVNRTGLQFVEIETTIAYHVITFDNDIEFNQLPSLLFIVAQVYYQNQG